MRMAKADCEVLQKRILQFYLQAGARSKATTVNHFREEEDSRTTVFSIIRKYQESGIVGDRPRSGRPATVSTAKNKQNVKQMFQTRIKYPPDWKLAN